MSLSLDLQSTRISAIPAGCGRAARTMAIAIVALEDPWAVRDLTICLRDLAALPPFAQDFVAHLRAPAG